VENEENPVRDLDFGLEANSTPTSVAELVDWSGHQCRQLRGFAERLAELGSPECDQKLHAAAIVLEDWIAQGFHPVVFCCRYIETAKYVGEMLEPTLKKKHPKLDLRVITSEDPDDLRKERIEA
jgi:hypothetical protein